MKMSYYSGIRQWLVYLTLVVIIFSCVDGDLLTPDPDAPIINDFTPKSGLPGSSVTIQGENFNGSPGLDSVYMNGYGAEVRSSSGTQIEVVVPSDATTGPIVVIDLISRKRAISSRDFEVLINNNPVKISNVIPNTGVVGSMFVINGSSFGTDAGDITVRIGADIVEVRELYDTLIVATVPTGAVTGQVNINKGGATATGPLFTVLDVNPVIDSLKPHHGPVGAEVWIFGQYFSTVAEQNLISFNGVEAEVLEAHNDSLKTEVPPEATTGIVSLSVNGKSTDGPLFTVDPTGPVIKSINPTSGKAGTAVSIYGENFSTTLSENIVSFNDAVALVTSASPTQIVATVPDDATTGPVKVVVNGVVALGPQFAVESSLIEVTGINPSSGKVGISVTISGSNFGNNIADNKVSFNGENATILSANTSEIVATVPDNATTGPVVVTVGGLSGVGPTFTVEATAPQITSLTPNSGQVGSVVKINGTNFGATPGSNAVTFNGTSATVSSASVTDLVVNVPAGASSGLVVVTVGGLASNGVNFTVEATPPQITSLTPNSGQVGSVVKINGTNFGATPGSNAVTFNGTSAIVSSASVTDLVVNVPAGASTGLVVVTVGGMASNGVNFTVEATAPQITSLTPNSGQVGSVVKINGTNFSATPGSNAVTFNGTSAIVSSASATDLVVSVPLGATTGQVVVTVGGLASNGVNFTVEATPPQITSINPTSGPYNTQVSISGTNFSDVISENRVFFNNLEAVISSASSTTLLATVPLGAGTGIVSVITNGLTADGPSFSYIKTGFVNTLAGNGIPGFVNGPGTTAQFNQPGRIAVDSKGQLILAELGSHSIRLISENGQVSTIAGNGTPGFANGTGANARFNQPSGVAIDISGNIYVADFGNNVIRKITPSNVVSIYAGNGQPGLSDGDIQTASFNGPYDVSIDNQGNLYVADSKNHAIRKIDTNGNVTTIAGNGTAGSSDGKGTSARFNTPIGIGIDQSNNILVADALNHTIRRVDPGNNVSTIAGAGGTSGSNDGNVSMARFNLPSDIDVDENGNLYVADYANHKIRIIKTNSIVETLAGTGSSGFVDGPATDAQFNFPIGVTVVNGEIIYVGDVVNHRIRVITFD